LATKLFHTDTILAEASGEFVRTTVSALDKWVPRAPAISKSLLKIAGHCNPQQRRIALWELLGSHETGERTRILLEILGAAHRDEREGLRLLFTFLCGRPTTFLYPEQIAGLRHCRRLGARLLFHDPPVEDELAWLVRLQELLPTDCGPAALGERLDDYSARLLVVLAEKERMPFPFEAPLIEIINLEGEAASLRGSRLVEKVGDYDPRAIAKLLPLVVALDEWQGDLHSFAERGAQALKHPLEQFLGSEETQRWKRSLEGERSIAHRVIASWVRWMEGTQLVGSEPAAWSSLLRNLDARRYRRPLDAALLLPQRWRDGRLGLKKRPPQGLFPLRAIIEDGDFFWVNLDKLHWTEWVSADGLPALPDQWRDEESPLLLLRSRMQDESFCERILGNEAWTSRQGVVETIARGSRSLKVLLRIARDRKLYTGSANRSVPLALLENPTNTPVSVLRPFLSLRYISRHDLTRLARGGPEHRTEISREARNVLRYL